MTTVSTTTTTTDEVLAHGELTNTCTCSYWDEGSSEYVPSEHCFGDCWDDALYSFGFAVEHLLAMSNRFGVAGLQLWYGPVDGEFTATNVGDFVRGVTVNSSWTMRYSVYADRMEYSLSHHDAPTGSSSVVRPIVESDDDE